MCLFVIFHKLLIINWVATGAQNGPFEYPFCFICSQNCVKNISSRNYIDLFCSEFNNIILGVTTAYFELVGGVTEPLIFYQRRNIFSRYRTDHYKINRFLF